MDIYSLKIFLSASETLNFTKTAQEFYLAQPGVSRRIRELEAEFGCQLFVRHRHGVTLTEAGKTLVPAVKRSLEELDCGIEQVKELARQRTGEISIAAMTPATNWFLPSVIGEFSITHPKVHLEVLRMVPKKIMESFALGSHDIYFSADADIGNRNGWESCPVVSDEIGLIVRDSEELNTPEEARVFLASNKVYLIPLEDSPATTSMTKKILKDLQLGHLEQEEVRPVESLMFNIASGLGVAVLPNNIINLSSFGLKFVSLGLDEKMTMRMLWRTDAPKQVIEFTELVKTRIHK